MLVTKQKYAFLCKCDVHTIYNRIIKKYIKITKVKLPDGSKSEFIDTVRFPPVMIRTSGGGRKKTIKKKKKHLK